MAKSLRNDVGEGTAVDERGEASLFGKQGVAALAMARAEPDPDSLGAARRLRAHFSPELAAAALSQVALRRRAHAKFGDQAAHMWFTSAGLEQASRPAVAAWRARRLAAAGCTQVLDLGCGIGADAMAFAAAGLHVHAVELDAITANLARANLASWPHAQVITGDVIDLTPRLLADYPTAAIFIDPARRTAQGRSWKMADLTPQWDFVLSLLGAGRICCIKLGPGLPAELIPDDVQAVWVSEHGDVVEAGLWRQPGMHGSRAGLLLPGEHWLDRPDHPRELPVRAPGRYLYEPDGAVIRAGALTELHPTRACGCWRLGWPICLATS